MASNLLRPLRVLVLTLGLSRRGVCPSFVFGWGMYLGPNLVLRVWRLTPNLGVHTKVDDHNAMTCELRLPASKHALESNTQHPITQSPEPFFSVDCGAGQRLRNPHPLLTQERKAKAVDDNGLELGRRSTEKVKNCP